MTTSDAKWYPRAPGQGAECRQVDVDRSGAHPPRVGFDHQQDRKVVEHRRDGGHRDDLQIRDLQELGDEEGSGAQGGRRHDGADPGGRQDARADVGRITRAPEEWPADGAEGDGCRNAAPRDRAEKEARQRDRASGSAAAARSAHGGHRPVDEELTGARVLQDGAVDCEQHDVGCGDVQGDAEDSLQRHVERADDPDDRVAAMRDQAQTDEVEERPEVPIDQESEGRRRQNPTDGAARRFEHEADRDDPEGDIEPGRRGGAVDELPEVDDRPGQRDHGGAQQQPVDDADAGSRRARTRKQEEGQRQRHHQERDAIDLRLDDADDPVERVGRHADRQP